MSVRLGLLDLARKTSLINFVSSSGSPPLARDRVQGSALCSVITASLPLSGVPTTSSPHGQSLTYPCSVGALAVRGREAFTTIVISPLSMTSVVLWAMLVLSRLEADSI